MTPELRARILKHVKDGDTVTDEDCWEWTGSATHGTPTMRLGRKTVGVRRLVLTAQGVKLGKRVASVRCLTTNCVSPGCCVAMTLGQIHQRRVAVWGPRSPVTCQRIAAAARARRSPFTPEDIASIRADPRNDTTVALERGVTKEAIGQIRRGQTWKTYTANPFAGLGTP